MAVTATGALEVGTLNATAAEITMTTETVLTLYAVDVSGPHERRRITIEFSPNGTDWVPSAHSINGHDHFMTENIVALKARACVCRAEESAASVNVTLMAR